jgi:hypothetical protein
MLIAPLEPPLQLTLLLLVSPQTTGVGCVTINTVLFVHPFASVANTVYVPADNDANVAVVLLTLPG